jgi:hypothetical protein
MKYQYDELKKELNQEISSIKSQIESKHKEIDAYVIGF